MGSDGLFAYLIPYSMASCTDGTTSTIAFAESVTGPPVLSYVPGISLKNVGDIPTGPRFQCVPGPGQRSERSEVLRRVVEGRGGPL